jgi:YHS domain-containing protein
MKKRNLIATLIVAFMAMGVSGYAEKKEIPKKQTTCPVMGGKINKTQYADVKGKRIYVCCPGCIGKIKADPDKYIKQMEAKGIVIDKTPKKHDHSGHKHGHDHSGHKH